MSLIEDDCARKLKPCPFCGKEQSEENFFSCDGYPQACGCWETTHSGEEAVNVWNTRPIEDELRAEIARLKNQVTDYLAVNAELVEKVESRDEKIDELEAIVNPASFRKFLVGQIKDPELAEAYVKACIQDTTYKELLASRDEIITRLKEDAERLANIDPDVFCCQPHEYFVCSMSHDNTHDEDCPMVLHRALMKELK